MSRYKTVTASDGYEFKIVDQDGVSYLARSYQDYGASVRFVSRGSRMLTTSISPHTIKLVEIPRPAPPRYEWELPPIPEAQNRDCIILDHTTGYWQLMRGCEWLRFRGTPQLPASGQARRVAP